MLKIIVRVLWIYRMLNFYKVRFVRLLDYFTSHTYSDLIDIERTEPTNSNCVTIATVEKRMVYPEKIILDKVIGKIPAHSMSSWCSEPLEGNSNNIDISSDGTLNNKKCNNKHYDREDKITSSSSNTNSSSSSSQTIKASKTAVNRDPKYDCVCMRTLFTVFQKMFIRAYNQLIV
ncbi:hypothetical protein NQ315_013917 [Exocentrus adspersus]|uniref:Uncharacterized protein n=1 Tax=Exocentrus adspersus TaxID=1586481 RepID=A0AAV8VQP3_9CUCU|nr:hypothetical protein NQ315_013917 [Exocentrus adspersus]